MFILDRYSMCPNPNDFRTHLHAHDNGHFDVPFRFIRELLTRLGLDYALQHTLLLPINHLSPPHRLRLVLALRTNLELLALLQPCEASSRTTQDNADAPHVFGHGPRHCAL